MVKRYQFTKKQSSTNEAKYGNFAIGLKKSVGIFGLFDGKAIPWKKGTEKAMLEAFKKSYQAGDFASYIKAVDKKREENTAKLLDARKKKGKTATKSK